MKHVQLIGVMACVAAFAGCESTNTAGQGNQEAKRIAAAQEEQQAQPDESQRNLWNAQRDILTRDGNASLRY